MFRIMILAFLASSVGSAASFAMACVKYQDYMHRVGSVEIDERAYHVVLVEDHAIVSVLSGLRVFDIADPGAMIQVGVYDWDSFDVWAMEVGEGYLYVVGRDYDHDSEDVLHVFDISDITDPTPVGHLYLAEYPRRMAIAHGHLYLTYRDCLCIYDLSDPIDPELVTKYSEHCGHSLEGILVEGDTAYLTNASPRLVILDVSHPAQPRYLGGAGGSSGYMRDVCVKDGYAYIASGNDGVAVYHVSDPHSPVFYREIRLTSHCYHVRVLNDHVFASTSGYAGSGLWVIGTTNGANPQVVNFTSLSTYPHDFDFRGDHAFIASYYLYHGSFLESVNIEDPGSVPGVQQWYLGTGSNGAVVYREPFAYWAGRSNGQSYIRSAHFPSSSDEPQAVGRCDIEGFIGDMAFCGDYIYVSTRSEFDGIHIAAADDQGHLQCIGSLEFGGMVYAARDIAIRGDHAYVATNGDGVYILDVLHPSEPVIVGGIRAGEGVSAMRVVDDRLYLSLGTYSGMGEIEVWQIVDPLQPRLMGTFDVGEHISDLDVYGQHVLACSESNMLIVDFSNPAFPQHLSTMLRVGGEVDVSMGFAFVMSSNDMNLVDVRNAYAPVLIGGLRFGATDVAFDTDRVILSASDLAVAPTQCVEDLGPGSRLEQSQEAETTDVLRLVSGCMPNPFNPSTRIWYSLEEPAHVSLLIYDLAGRQVAVLRDGCGEQAGYHEAIWDGRDELGLRVPSGTYVYRLVAGDITETKRLTLLK